MFILHEDSRRQQRSEWTNTAAGQSVIIMSAAADVVEEMCTSWANEVCAHCGKAEVDDIKLSECTACRFVRYCSVGCEKKHLSKHMIVCNKSTVIYDDMIKISTERAPGKNRDDDLFKQNKSTCFGDCPICCLPLPIDMRKTNMTMCCSKIICAGCSFANALRERQQGMETGRCPFCREPVKNTQEEGLQNEENKKMFMERVKANDPFAISVMGKKCDDEGDYEGAIQYWMKAAELGNMDAHYNLSCMYHEGRGAEKDLKRAFEHLEEAAIGGHPLARSNLGFYENQNGRMDRAFKHWIIAAKLGHNNALEAVKKGFVHGRVSKEDYEAALRGHQAAVDETKSEQREEAFAFGNLSPEDQRRWLQSFDKKSAER